MLSQESCLGRAQGEEGEEDDGGEVVEEGGRGDNGDGCGVGETGAAGSQRWVRLCSVGVLDGR